MAGFGGLSPMDAFRWFQPAQEYRIATDGGWTQILPFDSMRVAVIFSTDTTSSGLFISTVNDATVLLRGIPLTVVNGPIMLTQSQHGSLVQCAWYAVGMLGIYVNVISLSLADWPEPGVYNDG